MSKKRGAMVQISKDGVAISDDDDDSGGLEEGIPLAAEEELKKRRRVKLTGVKRPEPVQTSEEQEAPTPNLFGAIKLTATPAPARTPTPTPTPTPTSTPAVARKEQAETVDPQTDDSKTTEAAPSKVSGFAAYKSANPFAAIAAKQSPKSANPYSSPNAATNPFTTFTTGTNAIWAAASGKSFGSGRQIIAQKPAGDQDEGEDGKEDVEAEVPVTGPPPATAALFQDKEVELRTGEEDETCRLEMRAKLYRFGPKEGTNKDDSKQKAGNEWFDVGVGPLRVLVPKEGSADSKAARLVMRRETKPKSGQATKLLLNVLLKGRVTAASGGERAVRMTCIEMQEEKSETAATAQATDAGAQPKLQPVVVSYMFRLESAEKAGELLSTLTSLISS